MRCLFQFIRITRTGMVILCYTYSILLYLQDTIKCARQVAYILFGYEHHLYSAVRYDGVAKWRRKNATTRLSRNEETEIQIKYKPHNLVWET